MKPIGWKVNSSTIELIGHDLLKSQLFIKFKSAADKCVYRYENAPHWVFKSLLSADSVGAFFAANIKSIPVFTFTKIDISSDLEIFREIKDSASSGVVPLSSTVNWVMPIDPISTAWSW